MKKHTKVCRANEGITPCFDNGKIISFQDNFEYLGDVPFTVYFDFEATTGDTGFFEPKMFVMSYCQMKSFFHPGLNFEKTVISRSFQTAEEIYNFNHFKQERVAFFNSTTFHQLKDATLVVLAHEPLCLNYFLLN